MEVVLVKKCSGLVAVCVVLRVRLWTVVVLSLDTAAVGISQLIPAHGVLQYIFYAISSSIKKTTQTPQKTNKENVQGIHTIEMKQRIKIVTR